MKWIRTSEQMPGIDELVIVYLYDLDLYPGCISMAMWDGIEWLDIEYRDKDDDEDFLYDEEQVTHWMKFPDKPFEDEK